jgi:hypothetical protein
MIEPARRTLSVQARLFIERLDAEVARIRSVMTAAIARHEVAAAPPVKSTKRRSAAR